MESNDGNRRHYIRLALEAIGNDKVLDVEDGEDARTVTVYGENFIRLVRVSNEEYAMRDVVSIVADMLEDEERVNGCCIAPCGGVAGQLRC